MQQTDMSDRFGRKTILRDIVTMLEDMPSDWEDFDGEIGLNTRLVADLACSSVEIVELAVMIEDHFDMPNLPFQDLLMTAEGRYIDDLQVSDLVDFVATAAALRAGVEAAG